MKCPKCNNTKFETKDSRIPPNSNTRRRRKQCHSCKYKFNTVEYIKDEVDFNINLSDRIIKLFSEVSFNKPGYKKDL